MNVKRYTIIVFIITVLAINYSYSENYDKQFERLYKEYEILRVEEGYRSYLPGGDKIIEMAELGPPIIPLFIQKLNNNPEDIGLHVAFRFLWDMIVSKRFDKDLTRRLHENNEYKTLSKMYEDWWYEGIKDALKQYYEVYANWKEKKNGGNKREADLKLREIRNMGKIVIPYILENLKKGETEFLPLISFLTGKESLKTASAEECVAWCEANRAKWFIEIPKDDGEETKEN